MADLTEALQTIISIMKNSTTGVGTTGYEITDDASSGLTIADGEILVTASLSKDELKDQFGGTQDYDVIIVVRSEEAEDEWIGLSTKRWTEKVIIEVNVIDKWSAVATKYITGDLVRYKVVNAIRKFVKANTNAPGGTINVWKLDSVVNEVDKTTRPVTYKGIISTEAWMYYNPTGQGSVYGESPRKGGKEEEELEEGSYSSWAVYDSFDDTYTAYSGDTVSQFVVFNRIETIALLVGIEESIKTYTISTKALSVAHVPNAIGVTVQETSHMTSAYGTYFVCIYDDDLYIFKDGVEVQVITRETMGLNANKVATASISPKGTYIAVAGQRAATTTDGWVILIGS